MEIQTAIFIKGVRGSDPLLESDAVKIAFVGRSNVGKSSVINSLTERRDLAHSSAQPGRTRELNIFLINDEVYFIDLPGYGYAKASKKEREKFQKLINWYLFVSGYSQSLVVLIIDAKVGPTNDDLELLEALMEHKKDVVVVANKIDKLKQSERTKKLRKIVELTHPYPVVPYSAKKGRGVKALRNILLQ